MGALLLLVGSNAWLVRRQFPNEERRMNAAYDAGLRALADDGDWATAEQHFREYLSLDPRHARVHYFLGAALKEQGKSAEAQEYFEKSLALDRGLDEALIGLAEVAWARNAYSTALEAIERAIADPPTPANVYILKARILRAVGNIDGAEAAYRAATLRDPTSYESFLAIGDILTNRALLNGSIADRERAAEAYANAETICRSRGAMEAKEKSLGIAMAKAMAGRGRLQNDEGLSEAVALLERVSRTFPDDPEPRVLVGTLFRNLEQRDEARRWLLTARQDFPDDLGVLIELHELYVDMNDPGAASQVLLEAIDANAERASLRVKLIGFLVAEERYDEARTEIDRALQSLGRNAAIQEAAGDLGREQARRFAALAQTAQAAQFRDESIVHYEKALELSPDSLRLKKKLAGQLIEIALNRAAGTEPTEAETRARGYLDEVLTVFDGDPEALAWKCKLLLLDGHDQEVVETLRPTLTMTDPPMDALTLLGAAAERIGDIELAAEAYTMVVDRRTIGRAGTTVDGNAAPQDWMNLLRLELLAGRGAQAVDLAARAVVAHDGVPELRVLAARCELEAGDLATALDRMELAARRFPTAVQVRYLLATCLERSGRIEDAEAAYQGALADFPEFMEATRGLLFEFLARTGRADQAEDGLLELIAADPEDPDGYLRLGDFYLRLTPPRRDAARRQYEQAAELAPDSPAPLLRLGELYFSQAADDPAAMLALEELVGRFVEALPADPHVEYLRGKLALSGASYDEAVERLTAFLELRPNESAGHYYLGLARHGAGDLAGAMLALQDCLSRRPDQPGVRARLAAVQYELGLEKFKAGDFEAARGLFAQAEAGGAVQGNRVLLAGAHANAGRLDVSEKECRALLADEPDNRVAAHLLSALLLRKGTIEALTEAERLFRELRRSDPEDVLAIVGLGTVQFQRRVYGLAVETFREAYARVPGDPGVALGIAQSLALENKATEAVDFLDGEAKAHPESDALLQIKGDFLVHLELYDDAIPSFLAAFELNRENTGALLAAAAAHMQTGDYEAARQLLVENVDVPVTPALVQVALADVLIRLGRLNEATRAAEACLALRPDFHRALLILGKIAEREGQPQVARGFYADLVQQRAIDPEPYVRLAQILALEGKGEEAIVYYRGALERDARNAMVLNNLALLLADRDDGLPEAIELAERAYRLRPDLPELLDTHGWLLYRDGRVEEAAVALRRASNLLLRDAEVQYHAGMALSRAGELEDARRLLRRALSIDPEFEHADTAQRELDRLR